MLTDWFPPSTPPARPGLYITKYSKHSDCWHMMFWNGQNWYAAECANGLKQDNMSIIGGRPNANTYCWRGLTEEAK